MVQIMGLQANRRYLSLKPANRVCSDTCAVRVAWILSSLAHLLTRRKGEPLVIHREDRLHCA
jgi:hypothetical protein